MKLIYIILIVIFPKLVSAQMLNTECLEFKKESIVKLNEFYTEIVDFPDPNYVSQKELIAIVLPEYLTYSSNKNKIEVSYVKMSYQLNMERFKTISFGPFQMQLRFIKENLDKYPLDNINAEVLKNYNNSGYEYLIKNIEQLNKLEIQWEILRIFEYNHFKNSNNKNFNNAYINLIRKYNSGGTVKPGVNNYFTKINCDLKTYEIWCLEMSNW